MVSSISARTDLPRIRFDKASPWKISADSLQYEQKNETYIAEGNVTISREDKTLRADYIRYDQKNNTAYAKGNVRLKAGEDVLSGEMLVINLQDETGTLYNGKLFIQRQSFHLKSSRIDKTGENTYTTYKASVTTCEGEPPAWKITSRRAEVIIEDYVYVHHAALWVGPLPVLYTPFFFFPAGKQRRTGFLIPDFGHSERRGIEINQPFYWVTGESSDATFYEHYMSDRGHKLGVQYRYVRDPVSRGTYMFDYLSDRKIDDGTGESTDKWGFYGDEYNRTNTDRYWLRGKSAQTLFSGFTANLDIDVVSDQDYLTEFRDGYTGYKKSRDYFRDAFNRRIDQPENTQRINRLNLNRAWSVYNLDAEFRYIDNVITKKHDVKNHTIQKLPFVGFDVIRSPFERLPVNYEFDSGYGHFYSEDGARGHRLDLYSRLSKPLHIREYMTILPAAGFRETIWQVDEYGEKPGDGNEMVHRELFDVSLKLNSILKKKFDFNEKHYSGALHHRILPEIEYHFNENGTDSRYPGFDYKDCIERRNLLTYSVINILSKEERDDFRRLGRLELKQSYDFKTPPEKGWYMGPETEGRSFSPIHGELEIHPFRFLSLRTDADWSPYDAWFENHNVALDLRDKRGDELFVEHRYIRDFNESVYARVVVSVAAGLTAVADYERNIEDNRNIRTGLQLTYRSQCWSVTAEAAEEEDDRKISVQINLFGLGGF